MNQETPQIPKNQNREKSHNQDFKGPTAKIQEKAKIGKSKNLANQKLANIELQGSGGGGKRKSGREEREGGRKQGAAKNLR